MAGTIGQRVVSVLERAGRDHLGQNSPLFQVFGQQIGATTTLIDYDQSRVYWQRVQMLLDAFFSARERSAICANLAACIDLARLPEARDFLFQLQAERRLAVLLDALNVDLATRAAPPSRS